MHNILDETIQKAERGLLEIKIPKLKNTFEKRSLMHYHFNPEIFIQMEGVSEFSFPNEELVLHPGQVCMVPSGVPHKESVKTENAHFRNMVIAFYHDTISVHFAFEASHGKPDIEVIEFFYAPNVLELLNLTNLLIQTHHSDTPAKKSAERGLGIAFFSLIRNLVDLGNENFNSESGKVFQVKWLVREQISNPALNVKNLAAKLQCSADYLSHLFHQATEERLAHYIQRQRIESAKLALEATPLNVSEIAWSSGFSDPAYFARVFKKFAGEPPHCYRDKLEKKRRLKDKRPKTVYHDRVDFSMGRPSRKRRTSLVY